MAKKVAIAFSFFTMLSGVMLSSAVAANSIKIGVLLPLSGSNAPYGQIQKKSALMAADEINASGAVKDKKIELIMADTRGNPDGGRAAIEKLINRDRVLVLGGGFSSSATWAASAIAQQNSIAFVVTSAAADKITEQGWNYIFRLNQPLSEHLEALASFLSVVAVDLKSVAIVHANSLKSSAAARRFFMKVPALGLTTVIRERFETGAEDLAPILARVKAKNPDFIYAVADNAKSAALLMRQAKALKLNPKLLVGEGNGFGQPDFSARAANHIVHTALWTSNAPYRGAGAFNKKFIERFKTPPGHYGAEAYAGIYVIADALRRSPALTPATVRNALAHTDMTTALGPIKFSAYNKKSQQNKLPTFLVQWINGKREIIWPQNLATKKAVYPAPR